MYDRQNIDNMWYYDQSILTEWLLSLPKPIAIMACDDNQGNILLQACELCGLHVPFDVAKSSAAVEYHKDIRHKASLN